MSQELSAGDPRSVPASERRVRALIDSILETESLSERAGETLQYLKNSDCELSSADVEDLMELLQEVS